GMGDADQVDEGVTPGDAIAVRRRVQRVGRDDLRARGGARFRTGTDQGANSMAAAEQLGAHAPAHKPACPGQEDDRHDYLSRIIFCNFLRLPLISSVASWICAVS